MTAARSVQAQTPTPYYREITDRDGILIWQERPQRIVCRIDYPRDDTIAGYDSQDESTKLLAKLNSHSALVAALREI
jgi:hypothetical protein